MDIKLNSLRVFINKRKSETGTGGGIKLKLPEERNIEEKEQ